MKLYTEEQVRLLLGEHLSEYWVDKYLRDIEHIELPSDWDIQNAATIDDGLLYDFEFIDGAQWVVNLIKQQAIP